MLPKDIEKLYVRNTAGRWFLFFLYFQPLDLGSPRLERFNGFPSMNIQGEAAPGEELR